MVRLEPPFVTAASARHGRDPAALLPVWSPDGSKVLFYRDKDGRQTLRTVALDGTGQTQIADAGDGLDLGAYW